MCELTITWRQIELIKFSWTGPPEFRVLEARRLADDRSRDEVDHERRSGVGDREQRSVNRGDLDAKFFTELAVSALEQGFARLELSARKFPQPAVPLLERTPAHEICPIAFDYRRDYAHVVI
jgi:hypothetical protein